MDHTTKDSEMMKNNFDIFTWWKIKAPRFPILSQMAQDILLMVSIFVVAFK